MRSCPELVILRRGVLFSNGQALCRRASFREAKRIGVSITAGPTPRCMRYTRGVPATRCGSSWLSPSRVKTRPRLKHPYVRFRRLRTCGGFGLCAHSRPGAVFYRYFRSAGGTSVISRAPRWKVT